MRGAGLSSQEEGQEGLCRPSSKGLLSQEAAWAKQARQEPPRRDCGKGQGQACAPGAAAVLTPPVACSSPASWDPEPLSLSGPALSRGPGDGGPELGWRRPAGRDQEEMGAGTLVLRAVCAAGSEAGGERRKEVCLQPPKAVRRQVPSSLDLPPEGRSGQE